MNNATDTRVTDRVTYKFATSADAWAFMRHCDAAGISAGFPGLKEHTVQVAIQTWQARETVDALSNGAEVVDYQFGTKA